MPNLWRRNESTGQWSLIYVDPHEEIRPGDRSEFNPPEGVSAPEGLVGSGLALSWTPLTQPTTVGTIGTGFPNHPFPFQQTARPPKRVRAGRPKKAKTPTKQKAKAKFVPVLCVSCLKPFPGEFWDASKQSKPPSGKYCATCAGTVVPSSSVNVKHGDWIKRHMEEETQMFKENRDGSGLTTVCGGCGQPLPLCERTEACKSEEVKRENANAERAVRVRQRRGHGVPT